ncbi:hypothetical protein [Pseudoalteromonas luteoviolacea]|uniref:PA14 domain-containing protein n=1 Tax=Pseudoalteromonas luteoviolacea S4060-1 TaxID=1365257 RepID=A0A167LVI7_9GAMM|nr:hypothetical protein [Pseudoalteromonas luteoviolacea]KZN65337.1 hypothetical protein N478_21445 [Pseudoalteromonas luteoviolacea S4060-1]
MKVLFKITLLLGLCVGVTAVKALEVLIPANAMWTYYDLPQKPSEGWKSIEFDDSNWPIGRSQLGYGEGDERTVVAKEAQGQPILIHYFRHKFSWEEIYSKQHLKLRLLVDDGARVFLNNQEVHRQLLPAESLDSAQLATGSLIEHSWYEVELGNDVRLKRENILAVEVRQVSKKSSDLSFNLALLIE